MILWNLSYHRLQVGGREGGREVNVLVNAHTDTSILVQTEEHIAMPAGHHTHKRGAVSLKGHRTNSLSDLCVHDHNLSWVHNEEMVLVRGGEDNLPTVHLWNALLPSVRQR